MEIPGNQMYEGLRFSNDSTENDHIYHDVIQLLGKKKNFILTF